MRLEKLKALSRASMPAGVVGMNFRNREMVSALNSRADMVVARDKMATKHRLAEHDIASPPTIAVIERAFEIEGVYAELVASGRPFVVKPARSARGRGILLCRKATAEGVETLSGKHLPAAQLLFHFYQILHGEFSFGRPHDTIIVEQLLETDSNWVLPDLPGPPDLRIIICEGQIMLAMARLPTRESDCKANLHCGGVGVGIDLQTGQTCGGVHRDRYVSKHPDTGNELAGHAVQDFDICLKLADKCGQVFGLGFMGVDIMRDVGMGPVVLEVNSRPGLAVQLANRYGMLSK